MLIAVFVPVSMDCVQDAQIFTGEHAESLAKEAFQRHTGVDYNQYLKMSFDEREEALEQSDTIGSYIQFQYSLDENHKCLLRDLTVALESLSILAADNPEFSEYLNRHVIEGKTRDKLLHNLLKNKENFRS